MVTVVVVVLANTQIHPVVTLVNTRVVVVVGVHTIMVTTTGVMVVQV